MIGYGPGEVSWWWEWWQVWAGPDLTPPTITEMMNKVSSFSRMSIGFPLSRTFGKPSRGHELWKTFTNHELTISEKNSSLISSWLAVKWPWWNIFNAVKYFLGWYRDNYTADCNNCYATLLQIMFQLDIANTWQLTWSLFILTTQYISSSLASIAISQELYAGSWSWPLSPPHQRTENNWRISLPQFRTMQKILNMRIRRRCLDLGQLE